MPEVDRAISDYFAARPDGEDVTVEVLRTIGRNRLVSLAGDRTLDTAKQDIGLLVAVRLVDLYGAARIQTRREDNGKSASTLAARSGPDWVNRYTPHRLLPNTAAHRIVLDTNAVRAIVHGDPDALDLDELRRAKGNRPVSIADPAWAELALQLLEGRLPLHLWSARVQALDAILDAQLPLVPSGHEAAAMSGMVDPRKFDFSQTRAYYRAVWRFVADARTISDFDRTEVFEAPNGARYKIGPLSKAKVIQALKERGQMWERFIASIRIGEVVDADALAGAILNNLGMGLDAAQLDKLGLVARVIAEYAVKANDPENPYVPNPNDAIDVDVLFAVTLPAVICTSDKKMLAIARRADASARDKVMNPTELLDWLRR